MPAESHRDRLLELEPLGGPSRAEYERALEQLFERRLGRFARLRYVVLAAAGAILALGLSSLALTEPATTSTATRAALLAMAAMGATWFFVAWRLARRGSVHLIADRRRIAWIVLVFAALQCAYFGWAASTRPAAIPGLLVALAVLVVAGVVFVVQRLREVELRTREELLRAALARR